MPKLDHRAMVSALVTVVDTLFVDLQAAGRTVPAPARAAFSLVQSWLAGDPVDNEALQAAASLSHEDGVPYVDREKDRTAHWARSTAGNLAYVAKKDRGWQGNDEHVLNAATCTIETLNLPGAKRRSAFDAIYKQALASAPVTKAVKATGKRVAKPKARSTNFAALLGATANRRLARRHPHFDETQRATPAALTALLTSRGFSPHAAVLAFDERYGGLIVAEDATDGASDWLFGAFACLQSDAHTDPRGDQPSWVPVAYSPNDHIYFLDEEGVAWEYDTIEGLPAARLADDGDGMMKRILSGD